MRSRLFIACALLISATVSFGQDDNPFKSIGKKAKVVTAYGGQVEESFDVSDVQRVGSVLINIRTKKIVTLLNVDSLIKKVSDNSTSSRWYSVDPMADKGKNISYSPYAFVLNNPILYNDPDGRNAVASVDQKNQTITVIAVYYVQTDKQFKENPMLGYSSKDVTKLNESINKELNKNGFTLTEGDYKGYKVQFQLTFKEGGTLSDSKDNKDNEKVDGISVGNTFTRADGNKIAYFKDKENEETGETKTVGGTTESHTNITMNSNLDTKRNKVHEIFHTLFFDNDNAKKGIGSYDRNNMPNLADINKLINNAMLPKVTKKEDE